MGKAFFLSLILHITVVAIALLFLKNSTLAHQQKSKSISLSHIVLKKSNTPQKKTSAVKIQKQKQSKIVQKSIQKKLTQRATAKIIKSKKVVKKLPKKQKKRPLAKRVTKEKSVKKANKSKKLRRVRKLEQKELKKARKLAHKNGKKSLKQTKTKVTHSKLNKLTNKKRQRRAQASKATNSSTYQKTIKTKKQADDSKIKALIYQAINNSTRVPRLARKLGILGEVYTCFRVAPGKRVSDISTSGGHPILQKEARATINRASYSFPTISHTMHLCINIKWR